MVSNQEWDRMISARGYLPEQTHSDLCEFLENGRCSVYRQRPFVCELYGLIESQTCPWGCQPTPRYLTTIEGLEFTYRFHTGASAEEARYFFFAAESEGVIQFTDSVLRTAQQWTRTERTALLNLLRQGLTKHLSPTALAALALFDKEND